MTRFMSRPLVMVLLGSAMLACGTYAQSAKGSPKAAGPTKMIDSFDKKTTEIEYSPYAGEPAARQEGYGVYYDNAGVRLSRVTVEKTDKAMHIEYRLPAHHDWGNWLSIRKEFGVSIDLSKYAGLELDVKVVIPSTARLRITLADLEKPERAGKPGRDELWWFDFPPGVLASTGSRWITLQAPFKGFRLSYGAGTRHNDGRKDFSRVIAYEINVISERGEHPKGVVLVNSLRAYEQQSAR